MTEDEAVKAFDDIDAKHADIESIHIDADALLLQFLEENGYKRIVKAYHGLEDRCSGFWYA